MPIDVYTSSAGAFAYRKANHATRIGLHFPDGRDGGHRGHRVVRSGGALLALLSFAVLGTSLHAFVTFGGTLNAFQGVLAWWALGFVPALAYAAYMLPWEQEKW
jgi:hypothetical protein